MLKFYCLHEDIYAGVDLRIKQLNEACQKLDIEFVEIDSSKANYTALPTLGKNDLLYNCAIGSQTMESLLLNSEVTTFYKTNPKLIQGNSTTEWTILHEKAKIPAPKTIFHFTNDRDLLEKYVDYLGDFPIVIKSVGSTRGIGTIKIETWQNLISTLDYLVSIKQEFIMREFIKAKSGCRMFVLGNEVIAAGEFLMNKNDFRNAADLNQISYRPRTYPEEIKNLAIKATHLANLEFSGVDFLEDEAGNYYLLEINFPTGFSGLIDVAKVDIPHKMVEYLKQKSLRNL